MKKMIIAAVLIMISAACFSENLTGFYGIPFGSTIEETTKIMTSKGWTEAKNDSDKDMPEKVSVEYTNKDGIYAGLKVESVNINFYKNKMYYAGIIVKDGMNGIYLEDVMQQIVKKYEMTQKECKDTKGNVFMWIFTDNSGNYVQLMRNIKFINFNCKNINDEYTKDKEEKVKNIASGDI